MLPCGRTPLQEAIYKSQYEKAKQLIREGDDVKCLTRLHCTSLHLACQNKKSDTKLVEMLLKGGCPLDPAALDSAASEGHLNLVRILTRYKVPLQERNCSGWNALSYAAADLSAHIVFHLLRFYPIRDERGALFAVLWGFNKNFKNGMDILYVLLRRIKEIPDDLEPSKKESIKKLTPALEKMKKCRKGMTTWFCCMHKYGLDRNLARLVGLLLYNTRFDGIQQIKL